MDIFDSIGLDIGYVLLGAIGVIFILVIMCIVLLCKTHSLKKKYKVFMSGSTMDSMEDEIKKRFSEINELQVWNKNMNNKLSKLDERRK